MSIANWTIFLPVQPQHENDDSTATTPTEQSWPKHEKSSLVKPQGRDDVDHPEFDQDSKWPRRLLNVKDMTSYQWQPGNKYGGVSNPKYSIISYTWGRWRIRDSKSTVEALSVKGIPWEMPKVDPSHFTAQQFKYVLDQIAGGTANLAASKDKIHTPVEGSPFVWVDVACLPQSEDSPTANLEVGRQARIFRNAAKAYIWLTTADPRELAMFFQVACKSDCAEVTKDLTALNKLLTDPWFDSMWTLQGSVIKDTAYIVTSLGFCRLNDKERDPLELSQIRTFAHCYELATESRSQAFDEKANKQYLNFTKSWDQSGLRGYSIISPMQALACAFYRTCEIEHDRVYAIMQVFGDEFKVGKTRPASKTEPKREFTLTELEDELGTLILQQHPTISQLVQHQEPPWVGRAWRVCGKASVPPQLGISAILYDMSLVNRVSSHISPESACNLGTEAVGSMIWGTFDGMLCPFSRILECSRASSFTATWNRFDVHLDTGTTFCASHFPSDRFNSPPDYIIEHFGNDNLMVLLLVATNSHKESHCSALLLIRPGEGSLKEHHMRKGWDAGPTSLEKWNSSLDSVCREAWARVGILSWIWVSEDESGRSHTKTLEMDTLLGKSTDWTQEHGRWG